MARPYGSVQFVGPPGWRQIPLVTRVLLILPVLGYISFLVTPTFPQFLVLTPAAVFSKFQLWRLVTYPFVSAAILKLFFNLLLLWWVNPEVEIVFGSRSEALFIGVSTIVAGLAGTGLSVLLHQEELTVGSGLSGLLTSVIVAWALLAPGRSLLFFGVIPMTRLFFAVFVVVIEVAFALDARLFPQVLFVIGGIPIAWLWVRRGGRSLPFSLPRFLRRRRFRVVNDRQFPPYH